MKKLFFLFLALVASIVYIYSYDFGLNNFGYNYIKGTKNVELVYVNPNITSAKIPSKVNPGDQKYNVTKIGKSAFALCNKLTSVTIPNSVTSIGDYAFNSCTVLTSITLPNSVIDIGDRLFSNCPALSKPIYNSHVFAFMPQSYSGAYTIPDGINTIAGSAFYDCKSLTSLTIPNSVTSIGERAFFNCSSLTSVNIPDSVTSIGTCTFYNCSNLTSITIGNSVTSIGDGAFQECRSLTSITLPNNITNIGVCPWGNCRNLEYVYCESAYPATLMDDNTFIYATPKICVPNCAYTTYINAPYWKNLTIVPITLNLLVANNTGGVVLNTCGSMKIEAIPFSGYQFKQWLDGSTENPRTYSLSQSNLTFIAEFENAIKQYTIIFNNYNDIELQKSKFDYGSMPIYMGETPIKPSDKKYEYSFSGWSPELTTVTSDAIYTAYYDSIAIIYNIVTTSEEHEKQNGYVNVDGLQNYGEIVTLTAIPETGYYFVSWNDGDINNPREINVLGDTILYPIFKQCKDVVTTITKQIYKGDSFDFGGNTYTKTGTYTDTITLKTGCDSIVILKLNVLKPKTYTLRLEVNDEAMGTISGTGTYREGQSVTVSATPNAKYMFVRWYNEDANIDVYDNPYTFTITKNMLLKAVFRKAPRGIAVQSKGMPAHVYDKENEDVAAVVSIDNRLVTITPFTESGFQVFDKVGQLLISGNSEQTIQLPSGMYLIHAENQTEKFIIQ